jgi:4'-phosphopantetheinyl transferase
MPDHSRLTISAQNIDIWLSFYQDIVDAHLLSNLRTLLSDAERRQEKRFYFADDRKRYLVTRAMVRTVLSRYAAVAPADWAFWTSAYGRPEIANRYERAAGLCFNVSHTHGLIALAVSQHRALGVDVENLLARQMSTGIADRFFSPTEVAELASVPHERRQDRFFEYWTLKESYIKARGMGLSIPLDRFSFHYPHERAVRIAIDPELGDDESRWSFWQFRPTSEYVLAVCAQRLDGEAPVLTVRTIVPTVSDGTFEAEWSRTSERCSTEVQSLANKAARVF